MKKLVVLFVLCASGLLFQTTSAQVSFQVNIASQPIWGPVGYDHVEYYYLPEIEAYYYVPGHTYFYMENGRWINRPSLPARYRNFDLYKTRKVVINEPRPYMRHNAYRTRYAKSGGRFNQQLIRDSHEQKYFQIKDHPEHSKWRGNQDNRGQYQKDRRMNQDNRGQYQNNRDLNKENKGRNQDKNKPNQNRENQR